MAEAKQAPAPVTLPGRLGDDSMTLGTDPRADPNMIAMIAPMGIAARPPPSVNGDSPAEATHGMINATEPMLAQMFAVFSAGLPAIEGLSRRVEVAKGVDDNDINLHISMPAGHGPDKPAIPCVIHLHGGGLVQLTAEDPMHARWRDCIAGRGCVVVGVEFRNASGKMGPHPFPAGLNDCSSAVQWVHDNRGEVLNVSSVVVLGDSGGGNLALATCLKKLKDDKTDQIQGCFAMCPYIFGDYAKRRETPELPSLTECNAYFLEIDGNVCATCKLYTPEEEDKHNPLAWPYWASEDDLKGMPPLVVSCNELDPLRDEGLAFARKAARAGVSVVTRIVGGTGHGCDLALEKAAPAIYKATLREVVGFAKDL